MPVTEVVRIDEIDKHIERVGQKVRDGLLKLIKQGVPVEYPKSLDFQMTVLVEFEALTSTDAEVSKSTEIQGGFTTESQKSGGSDQQSSTERRDSNGANSHTENGDSTTETKQS